MSSELMERKWKALQDYVEVVNDDWGEDPQLISDTMEMYNKLCRTYPDLCSREFATPAFWKAFANLEASKEEGKGK